MLAVCIRLLSPLLVFLAACSCNAKVLPGGFVMLGEQLPADAVRITALGTGTPNVRKSALATGWLIQLGNGDNLIFDLGTGSYVNLLSLGIPQNTLTKVFLSHLHSDHIADLASLYIGAIFGRKRPLEVWGPSGPSPELGTAACIDALRKFMAWDTASRRKINLIGREDDGDQVVVHEFDHSLRNQLVYSRNGVNITSTPVHHYETEGPVALRLDWNGISVTYSGDTRPTQALTDLANLGHGTDVLLLENVGPVLEFDNLKYSSQYMLNTSHISPRQAGPILSSIKPRLASVHHLNFNSASRTKIINDIRAGYPEGALHVAEDLDVFEVNKQEIRIRKQLVPEQTQGYFEYQGHGLHVAPASAHPQSCAAEPGAVS